MKFVSFITSSNDDFYPSAAPLIYTIFLLTALVYVIILRPRKDDPRAAKYKNMDDLQEVLDRDLSIEERDEIRAGI
jgi:hypothetical protein